MEALSGLAISVSSLSQTSLTTIGSIVVLSIAATLVFLTWKLVLRIVSVLGLSPIPPRPARSSTQKWQEPLVGAGRSIPCVNPATGAVLGEEKSFTIEQVNEAVARAKVAQREWAATSFEERSAVLQDLLQHIVDNQDTIVKYSVEDSGKTPLEAAYGEILTTCEKIRWTMHYGAEALKPEWRTPPLMLMTKTARIEYHPRGVIGIIVPWNYPAHNVFSAVVSAIFAGNAAVVKVSEWASWSRKPYEQILRGVLSARNHNPDLVQIITGYGDTGEALCKSEADHIFFIGSPQTGKYVMRAASEKLTPVTLELGGKDPFIVFNSASIDQAVDRGLRGAFINCGQNCISAERFYVQSGIYDKFVAEVVEQGKKLRQGAMEEGIFDCGAMTMPRQIEIVEELVNDAISKGAIVACGGKRLPGKGQFYQPTILLNVNHTMKIANEEAFGPVMTIIKFQTEEEVIKMANSTEYALGSSIFTSDYVQAERVAKQILAGMCTVNDYGMSYLIQSMPFGGAKISGFGKFNGPEGLRSLTLQKTVVSDRFPFPTPAPAITRYPVVPHAPKVVQEACKMLYGRGLGYKISALGRLMSLLITGK